MKYRTLRTVALVVGLVMSTGFGAHAADKPESVFDKMAASAGMLDGKVIVDLNDEHLYYLDVLNQLSDELSDQHQSKRSVLYFFARPKDLDECGCRPLLEKLAREKRDSLIVVTVDPDAYSRSGALQRAWVQGEPAYPTAVFDGNGVLLNLRGALKSKHVESLVQEGLTWDWHKNHTD